MKIAFVAMPQPDTAVATPPLPLAYAAALLEQQRHIVRIYDLAVRPSATSVDPLSPLQTFKPHITVIAAADPERAAELGQRLSGWSATVLHLGLAMRSWADVEDVVRTLRAVTSGAPDNDQNVITSALLELGGDLDRLPAPARHLLPIEQYPSYTLSGVLQTPVLVGQRGPRGYQMRSPALLISELRSVTHEHGVLHFVLEGAPLTEDAGWLRSLLRLLRDANLGAGWEGGADYRKLTPDLLRECRAAGCEALTLAFEAMAVLDAKGEREALALAVQQAHELDIKVRGRISLESAFSSVPLLVDMSGTFGLDAVDFAVAPAKAAPERTYADHTALAEIAELAQARYKSSRRRQYFVERFGTLLGPLLWRVGLTGLLGTNLRQAAQGGEGASKAAAEG